MTAHADGPMAPGSYFFEDLEVGASFRTGRITVTESHIVQFAGIAGDFFDVHMDDEFARERGFPGRIAHGLLVLCLVDGLKNRAGVQLQAVASLGWSDWRFLKPVLAGDRIEATVTVQERRPTAIGERGVVRLGFEVRNQAGAIVQEGSNALLMRSRNEDVIQQTDSNSPESEKPAEGRAAARAAARHETD